MTNDLKYVRQREGYKELMAMPKEMLVYWMLTRHIIGLAVDPSKAVEKVRWEYMTAKLLEESRRLIDEMDAIKLQNPDGSFNYDNFARYMKLEEQEDAVQRKLDRYLGKEVDNG